jgi:hypothetical protein
MVDKTTYTAISFFCKRKGHAPIGANNCNYCVSVKD